MGLTSISGSSEFKTKIKKSFFTNNDRELIINFDMISFEEKYSVNTSLTQFNKSEIKDYRYGIKWIRGYKFIIGRDYQIFIRNHDNKVLKLNFKSFYGINRNIHSQKFASIVNSLWKFIFSEITSNFLERFQNKDEFTIGEVHFKEEGIIIQTYSLLKKRETVILWENVRTKNYRTYFAIYSQENPAEINRSYSYKDDWNTGVLYSVIRTILKNKGIESY